MRQALRENALCAFMAAAGCATLAWLGLYGFAWNDYEMEAAPSFQALAHGHLIEFLRLAPPYGGSLVERAPFALLPDLWGGGTLAIYRAVALPCLGAAALLGVWLVAQMRAQGHSRLARAVALGVCVANPITLVALEFGHPEELLGGCLCVAAVLAAGYRRPLAAGVLLGLAIANKDWALVAAGPVLLALPARQWLRCMLSAGAVTAAVLAPLVLASSNTFTQSAHAITSPYASIFQPWQVWWFLGAPNHVHAALGAARSVPLNAPLSTRPEWRLSPSWLDAVAHLLIILIGVPLTLAAWRARKRTNVAPRLAALHLLALLLLLRCMLDPWDTTYYLVPFLLALLVWEALANTTRPPVLALASTALAWVSFQWLPSHVSPDVQSALFLAWSLPLAFTLAARLLGAGRPASRRNPQPRPNWTSMPAR